MRSYQKRALLVSAIIVVGGFIIGLFMFPSFFSFLQPNSGESSSEESHITSDIADVPTPEPIEVPVQLSGLQTRSVEQPYTPVEGEIRLRSVGDLLIHDRVSAMADTSSSFYQDAITRLQNNGVEITNSTQEYDFMPMLTQIEPFMGYADITMANLEVPAAYPEFPVSGYPQFNAPSTLLANLKQLGVDIVSNATNHTLDLFGEGAYATIHYLNEVGIMYVGSYNSWQDQQTPRIIEKNGIKLGFLAYSYGTNGIEVPEGEEYVISLIDETKMLTEVEALKTQVDAVVVSLQIGEEYETLPNEQQLYLFQRLSDAGVSLILGGHPHVLQPVAWFNGKETFSIYSQASFLTGQRDGDNKQGGITEVTFKRQEDGRVVVTNPKFMPIYVLGVEGEQLYEVVPMADYQHYAIPDGEQWWHTVRERMTHYTDEFQYVHHLETQWTMEDSEVFR